MNVQRVSNYINNSGKAQTFLKRVSKNPALFSVLSSFAIATTIRPITILTVPMKDKKNKKYSIASSVAAGLTDLAAALILFNPINKGIEKTSKVLWNTQGTIFYNNHLLLRKYKSISNRMVKISLMPFIALFRFSLVSPIVKTLFKKEGEKK